METAEITSPIQRRIGIHALGWSKATDGEISGNVMALNIKKPSDLEQYKGKLKGAIVMLRKPYRPVEGGSESRKRLRCRHCSRARHTSA